MAGPQKPNILVIWGDDIGSRNLSCYTNGLMGYRTPNIDRIANEGMLLHRLLRRAELHRRAARRSSPGQSVFRTGPEQGRHARRGRSGMRAEDPDHRRAAQAARLRHRPVRQEPPRRPRRAPADRCTASTSSSATSTTSTPRRSRSCPTIRQPKDFPDFRKKFGPRGVLHCWAEPRTASRRSRTPGR